MRRKRSGSIVVGIDLAGSPARNTGICALRGMTVTFCETAHKDREILSFIEKARPVLIAIDAPLNLPPGRKTIEDRRGEHFRPCDRELLRRGIRFFPITLGPMRALTRRGIKWRRALERKGYEVIEVYPGAAQDIWGTGRKQHGLLQLKRGLERQGIKKLRGKMNGDELDAATAALVARMYLKGRAEVLGNFKEGAIVIPKAGRR